ncbi:hypothetical protein IWX50DRAFT_490105 [Phyllosticta citricarpa]
MTMRKSFEYSFSREIYFLFFLFFSFLFFLSFLSFSLSLFFFFPFIQGYSVSSVYSTCTAKTIKVNKHIHSALKYHLNPTQPTKHPPAPLPPSLDRAHGTRGRLHTSSDGMGGVTGWIEISWVGLVHAPLRRAPLITQPPSNVEHGGGGGGGAC